jgi:hypothetical protein
VAAVLVMRGARRIAAGLAPALLIACSDRFAEGMRAYDEGRHRDALAALTGAEQAAGNDAPAELLFDRALAALRVRDLRTAELCADKAAARGGAPFSAPCDFVLGNAAFARAELAAAEAGLSDPDPTAFARAIAQVEAAREHWIRAAAARDDWPAARRNVERAQRALEDLRRKQDEAEANRRARRAPPPEPQPAPPPPDVGSGEQVEQAAAPQTAGALTLGEVERLLALLERKEREKQALRTARQKMRRPVTEQDW